MIISLSGKAGSGKSTVAKYLAQALGAEEHHLATTLRDELASLGMPRALMESQEGKASQIVWDGQQVTVREAMCSHGAKRFAENPLWLLEGLLKDYYPSRLIVVDDVRRKNEATNLAFFGPVIRIEHFDETDSQDITELDLDDWPYFDMTMYPAFGELKQTAFHIIRGLAPWFSAEPMLLTASARLI